MASLFTLGIKDFRFEAVIGVYETERLAPQPLAIDVSLDLLLDKPEDAIAATFDYSRLPQIIRQAAEKKPQLLETLAEEIAQSALAQDPRLTQIEIEIRKPRAVQNAACSFVKITRKRTANTLPA